MTVYDDVALEIKAAIKDDLFDSDQFDKEAVVKVLERNFNVAYQVAGKAFLECISMFNRDTGAVISDVPGAYMVVFMMYGYEPVIPGRMHPNYDVNNEYVGYTKDGKFYRMRHFDTKTRIIRFFKERTNQVMFILVIAMAVIAIFLAMI